MRKTELNEAEFRFTHSELIEYYQYIEMRLKGICAALLADKEKNWIQRLGNYERDPLGMLINKLKEIQKDNDFGYLSESDFDCLDKIRERRNYWCHQCFTGFDHVTFSQGKTANERILKKQVYGINLKQDFNNAFEWNETLTEVFRTISKNKDLLGYSFDE